MPNTPVIQIADEVESLARVLVVKYHPHLSTARILYLFTDQKRKKCDRVTLASAAKMNSLQRFLASNRESVESGPDYVIIFDSAQWEFLTDRQKNATVDHELEHCKIFVKSGLDWVRLPPEESVQEYSEWKFSIISHDIEDFVATIQRHGIYWTEGPETKFIEIARQLSLPGLAVLVQSRN